MACHCSGDIEDHDTGEEYTAGCTCDCRDDDEGEDGEPDELVGDCGDPDCCMPGLHFRSECHTGADLEELFRAEGVIK